MLRRMMFFFFFQAEDGIRDLTVTGVQTCALPIFCDEPLPEPKDLRFRTGAAGLRALKGELRGDRKSTRLNSSHSQISYAVFCLTKKQEVPSPLARAAQV